MFQQGNNRASKLTGEQVMNIRDEYKMRGVTQPMLAIKYQVSVNTIANIVKGLTWQHLLRGEPREVNRPPLYAVMPTADEAQASMSRLQARLEENEARAKFVIPSLDEGAPTGIGLDKLNRLAEKELVVGNELDKLLKGD